MNSSSWRISLAVRGQDLDTGDEMPVVVGLVETAAGGIQIVLRVGADRPVILALQDANQLSLNVHEVSAERLKVTAEILGEVQGEGDRP